MATVVQVTHEEFVEKAKNADTVTKQIAFCKSFLNRMSVPEPDSVSLLPPATIISNLKHGQMYTIEGKILQHVDSRMVHENNLNPRDNSIPLFLLKESWGIRRDIKDKIMDDIIKGSCLRLDTETLHSPYLNRYDVVFQWRMNVIQPPTIGNLGHVNL